MRMLLQDVRFALRQLLKSPGFTLTAILSLACGIGATTAVFSVVYAVLLNPYPYAASDRMMRMRLTQKNGQDQGFGLTGSQWQKIRHAAPLEGAFATDNWSLTMTGQDLPEDVNASYMTSNAFQFFGVPTALGRGLIPSDAIDGQDPQPVAVLGYKFWQRHFNSDPTVIGTTIQLVHKPYTIVGVAAPRFTWDDGDVYLPLKITQDQVKSYYVGIRLKSGVSKDIATQQLATLITEFAKDTPKHFPEPIGIFRLNGLNDDFIQHLGGTLYLLFSAVALLLLIGCGNVSILLLARGTARQHEFAVRASIGASRWRIIRQLLTESLLLAITGAALGCLAAYKLLAIIVALLPDGAFPHEAAIQLNLPVLFFSVVIALITGIVFGLSPALRLSRPEVNQVMQSNSRKVTGSLDSRATSNTLIAAQIALTLLMMAGATAAIQGFIKLLHTPLGYDPHNVMSLGIPIHENTYGTWAARAAYFEALRNRVSEVPGVKIAAISTNATPPSNGLPTRIEVLGQPSNEDQKAAVNFVSPEYFPLLQIPLAQGRLWSDTENHQAAKVTVINQTMAKRYFPNGDAIGHSLKVPVLKSEPPFNLAPDGADGWMQIIGVIADKRDDGLRNPVRPELFLPFTMAMRMGTQILVKADTPPLTLIHAIGLQILKVDHDQQVYGQVNDLDHWISSQPEYQQERIVAWLFGAFAILALLLAAVGLYSVVSYTVAQRTNEFGIRMALGALRSDVLHIVFQSTAVSVGGGVAAGIALTLLLRKVLSHWAEGSAQDPWALLIAIAILITVALVASGIPARRASRVEPMEALRYE